MSKPPTASGIEQRLEDGRGAVDAVDARRSASTMSRVIGAGARLESGCGALVEHEDAGAEVLVATVHEHVELLGQRAHDGEREDADDDAEDGERRPQRAAPDVADRFAHGIVRMLAGMRATRPSVPSGVA